MIPFIPNLAESGGSHRDNHHFQWTIAQKERTARNTPDSFCRRFTPTKSSLRCVGGIFLQIEPYVVVQISEFYLQLLTAQLKSVILALERSRT